MDIGVPLRDLGAVDVGPMVSLVEQLTEQDWTEFNFRRDALADKVHGVTDNIVLKTEWHPSASTTGIPHFEDLVWIWASERGLDPHKFLPVAREETDTWPVFTMPDYARYRDIVEPLVEQAIRKLKGPRGVITRIALVRLRAGDKIDAHVDGHLMATRSHRIHVPLSPSQSIVYKIDGRKCTMELGRAYDFNNRTRHSVRNNGKRHRVNLFIDYCPDRGLVIQNPLAVSAPLYAPRTPVVSA